MFMLVLSWIYAILRRHKSSQIIQPSMGAMKNRKIIYPSSTSFNYPSNTFITSPDYQNIAPNVKDNKQ